MATEPADLTPALLGGVPLFDRTLYVGRPSMAPEAEVHARIQSALDRRWLTNDGPLVQELEHRCAERLQVPHCIAVANATLGLEVALRALGVQGEVLLPAFTFIGTAHAAQWLGLTPVFCDVRDADHGLDPAEVARRITPATGAILGVHLWGRACAVEALEDIARRHGIPLILDAAHAMGCGHAGRPLGSRGTVEVFSLHATKGLNSLEGGLVTTTDEALAQRIRLMRNFGIPDEDQVSCVGTNAKMNEFSAAVGLCNLDHFDDLCAHNHRLYEAYATALAGVPGLRLVAPAPGEAFSHHYIVLEVLPGAALDRDQLVRLLRAENVYARRYFRPGCHRGEPYRSRPGGPPSLPVTDRLSQTLLQLPSGRQLSPDEAQRLGQRLANWGRHGAEVAARLREAGAT
ncbi:DegT/DnrJ/EryC1/StrS family aminotransferase [Ideonella sp. B7]|uniref:DegT/DnrJ/EryC1/StrS family aminotransferase n=1 Tax=Ideonella benzenivorans TaxID=2831643 RepID=UPI001CECDBA8|nr:DegT/DnrJ/EryC1/StrS family aminotransferase [Ideonella benzenivorans]MCA6215293.1 DegT/DnrJ/EryC1/StrS family aminotransferase [Ideonella benzenivorans]